ncbi:MAG: hypothetical protein WC042_01555 [Candidatus Paceibacterota bacterium]|nr:hypothetical protein [Candidatus Paceibacterota bacterium]MDD3548725.1 hypothetical protein [Candidatus Paceibacterota bacterium]MDD4999104.1 hypothetical protein [Candidatus Paceibacterota bacterium]
MIIIKTERRGKRKNGFLAKKLRLKFKIKEELKVCISCPFEIYCKNQSNGNHPWFEIPQEAKNVIKSCFYPCEGKIYFKKINRRKLSIIFNTLPARAKNQKNCLIIKFLKETLSQEDLSPITIS